MFKCIKLPTIGSTLLCLTLLAAHGNSGLYKQTEATKSDSDKSFEIQLTTKNLITLRGPIDARSVSAFVRQFNELEQKSDVETIYVWIRSPGGSVFAGDHLTNVVSASRKPVVMIVDFAASMAFYITQFGTTRVMLPSGTLMQHHPSGGPRGGEFPNVDSEWGWLKRKTEQMRKKESASCTKTSYEQFLKNVDRDWWLLASEAKEAGCVDKVTSKIYCSKDLSDSTAVEVVPFFGMEVQVNWSGCPLEIYPRSVKLPEFRRGVRVELSQEQLKHINSYIELTSDPLSYFHANGSFELPKLSSPSAEKQTSSTTTQEVESSSTDKANENKLPRAL